MHKIITSFTKAQQLNEVLWNWMIAIFLGNYRVFPSKLDTRQALLLLEKEIIKVAKSALTAFRINSLKVANSRKISRMSYSKTLNKISVCLSIFTIRQAGGRLFRYLNNFDS